MGSGGTTQPKKKKIPASKAITKPAIKKNKGSKHK